MIMLPHQPTTPSGPSSSSSTPNLHSQYQSQPSTFGQHHPPTKGEQDMYSFDILGKGLLESLDSINGASPGFGRRPVEGLNGQDREYIDGNQSGGIGGRALSPPLGYSGQQPYPSSSRQPHSQPGYQHQQHQNQHPSSNSYSNQPPSSSSTSSGFIPSYSQRVPQLHSQSQHQQSQQQYQQQHQQQQGMQQQQHQQQVQAPLVAPGPFSPDSDSSYLTSPRPQYVPAPQHALPPDPLYSSLSNPPIPIMRGGMKSPGIPSLSGNPVAWNRFNGSGHLSGQQQHPSYHSSSVRDRSIGARSNTSNNGIGPSVGNGLGAPSAADEDEEISTIFVVGFPDDMQEREFQNMFTFSPLFEAATLKPPPSSSNNSGLGPPSSLGPSGAASSNPLLDPYTFYPSFPSTSSSNYPSSSATFPMGQAEENDPPPPRRQIIGFAKFKTRQAALDARDGLQGRRVDVEKGSVLKAEMAKKNLHTRRGVGPGEPLGSVINGIDLVERDRGDRGGDRGDRGGIGGSLQVGVNELQLQPQQQHMQPSPWSVQQQSELKAVNGQSGLLSNQSTGRGRFDQLYSSSSNQTNSAPPSLSIDSVSNSKFQSQPDWSQSISIPMYTTSSHGAGPNNTTQNFNSFSTNSSFQTNPSYSQSQKQQSFDYGSSLVSPSSMPPYPSLAPSSSSQPSPDQTYLSTSQASDILAPFSPSDLGNGSQALPTRSGEGSSEGSVSASTAERGSLPRTQNPADQNPPINTLYVGNLPTSPPPSHPPTHLEESLRSLFSSREGFRRMSFRMKSNGPMCFVEFDTTPHAAAALKELYGSTLSGFVKGGIRLSFSKHPLGVRGSQSSANERGEGGHRTFSFGSGSFSPTNDAFNSGVGGGPGSPVLSGGGWRSGAHSFRPFEEEN